MPDATIVASWRVITVRSAGSSFEADGVLIAKAGPPQARSIGSESRARSVAGR